MIKGQSKWDSFWEANANTFIGLIINLLTSPFVYWLVGMKYVWWQLGATTAIFTVISIVRGFVIRRWFNRKEAKKDKDLEQKARGWQLYAHKLAEQIQEERQKAGDLIFDYRREVDTLRQQVEALQYEKHEAVDAIWNTDSQTHNM